MHHSEHRILTFIVDNFLFGEDANLHLDTSFLDEGIIDSTGVLELVQFIEEEFDLAIRDDELIPENLDSIRRIMDFLQRKKPEDFLEPTGPAILRTGP